MKGQKFITVSLIIPAYNEASKIENDIRQAENFFLSAKYSSEIIASVDGCTDDTVKIIKKLQKEYSNLHLIDGGPKNGKGTAIKKGVEIAKGKYVMFADAGYCVPFEYIKDGISKIKLGYDCSIASRAIKKSRILKKQPFYRQAGSYIFGLIVRRFIGIPRHIKDTQCGFKIYKNSVAKILYSELQTNTFMFDIEIILRAKKHRFKQITFPVRWKNDTDTKFNPISGSIKNLKDLYLIKTKYKL